ncbi:hypothetical protein V5F38_06010 [Xanthobacter sp. V0B-10]|uniref:hypothetical protein n=1 Tax=Xanthobacter albus TaxID=3119929 RepID=UPI00372BA767
MAGMTERLRHGAVAAMSAVWVGLAIAGFAAAGPAMAQNDPLAPPPDLDAAGVPVPVDSTAILGNNQPPSEMMAIPAPPSTCAGLAAAVRQEGSVLVPTGDGNAQRYVIDDRYCAEDEVTKPAWLPMPDNPRCFVGYTCGMANNDGGK